MKALFLTLSAMAAFGQIPVFAPPSTYITNGTSVTGPSPYWSVAADFNGDGRPDLAAPDNRVADNIFGFSMVMSIPGGGFGALTSFPIGFYVNSMRAADFNNDGRTDMLLSGGTATAIVLGNGNGTFSAPIHIPLPVVPGAGGNCATADLNRDGNQDILVPGSSGMAVALGNGNGTFRPAALYSTPLASVYLLTGDFNNDGNLDAIVNVNSVSQANMFPGNGDGTFQPSFPILAVPFGAQAGDFNNDGKLDLMMQTAQPRQDGSNFSIAIALGTGTGQFLQYSNYVFPNPFAALTVADFDQDSRLDVAFYYPATGTLRVLGGRGDGTFGPAIFETPIANGPFASLVTDLDVNGSPDLVMAAYPQFHVFRNTRGTPPLLAQLTLAPPSVIGGAADSTATVTLGGAAPAGGIAVTLASSDPAASFPAGAVVTIPAGASSVTFPIRTAAVAALTSAAISAAAGSVTQTARLDIVAGFVLTGLTLNPASRYGIFTSTGTVTLNGPAASSTMVNLTSSNSALASVPAGVTVPAGATSVNFPVTLSPVAADTPVTITATFEGVSKTTVLTILSPRDSVSISKSLYTTKDFQLRVEATGTNPAATVTIHNAVNGALIGTLRNAGGGKFDGGFTVNLGPAPRITLKSSFGGTVTAAVTVK